MCNCLDEEEVDEEESVCCADGLDTLKIVSITSGNDDESCKEVSSDDDLRDMIPNRDKDSIKKEIKTELEDVHHVDEIIVDDNGQ